MFEIPDFFPVRFQFDFEGLCLEWVGQFEALTKIKFQNVMSGGVEVKKNIAFQQCFRGPHRSLRISHGMSPRRSKEEDRLYTNLISVSEHIFCGF